MQMDVRPEISYGRLLGCLGRITGENNYSKIDEEEDRKPGVTTQLAL